jgi:hypothetical protein
MHFLPFPWPINYNYASWCNKSFTHSLSIWFWLNIYFLFLEIMVSRMATSYGPQATQMNEELSLESSLDLTLTQHPCDEDPELWEVCVRLEINPPWAWYYCIYLNFCTLIILLQVDPVSGDEPKTVATPLWPSVKMKFTIPKLGT